MICGSAADLLYAAKALIKSNFHQIHFNIAVKDCLPIFCDFSKNFCDFPPAHFKSGYVIIYTVEN